MTTRTQAIDLARAEVTQGYALRHLSDSEGVHLLSDQGWQTIWTPADDDEPRPGGANDCNPDY